MARKFVEQVEKSNTEMFDSLVCNAIDFLRSSIDDLDHRPKNSIVDFYTAIELIFKARLMSEHWTLILSRPDLARLDNFRTGDFHSVSLKGSVDRIQNILGEKIDREVINNFEVLGEHRNQIVHFSHTLYDNASSTKAKVVVEQWRSWHHLYLLLTSKWNKFFYKHIQEIENIQGLMLTKRDYLGVRFTELENDIDIMRKRGKVILACNACGFAAAIVEKTNEWGDNYHCLICDDRDISIKPTDATIECPECSSLVQFFNKSPVICTACNYPLTTEDIIAKCAEEYSNGDDYCCDERDEWIAECHQCRSTIPSVFFIDGLWSCVVCHDRGWRAVICPHCDEFVTGDPEAIEYCACFKCEDVFRNKMKRLFDAVD